MEPKTLLARLFDLTSLLASNAFTACAAAVIALDSSTGELQKVFFPIDELADYALYSLLACVILAFSLWAWRSYQVRKLMTEDGYKSFPQCNEKPWDLVSDPVLRMRILQAKIIKNSDMQTLCLGIFLMAAGMITAMYLSNTGLTSDGSIANKTAYIAYFFPAALVCFAVLGVKLFLNGLNLKSKDKKWISLSSRAPKASDIEPGFARDIVLCRSPNVQSKWGGSHSVVKIVGFPDYLPPKGKREGIEWTFIPQ